LLRHPCRLRRLAAEVAHSLRANIAPLQRRRQQSKSRCRARLAHHCRICGWRAGRAVLPLEHVGKWRHKPCG